MSFWWTGRVAARTEFDDANVTSIDIDAGLVAEATCRLEARGYRPLLVARRHAACLA